MPYVCGTEKQVKGLILFTLILKNIGLHKSMGYWLRSYLLACLHDQNKSGFFGGPTIFQPIRAF